MRIIAGKYRGRRLKSPPSLQTRPTSDRLRETLFNILAPRIQGAWFLDLCAGTGAVGIEALSRGASNVTFVDQSKKICALIETNLEAFEIENDFKVANAEASEFLRKFVKKATAPFDIIFYDPPYAADYETVLNFIGEHAEGILHPEAIVIVEHDKRKQLSDRFDPLKRSREVKHGDSVLSFFSV